MSSTPCGLSCWKCPRGARASGSAHADVGQVTQLVPSLEATVCERDEARAELARAEVTYLGLLTSARDGRKA
eukprot:10504147-Alexandrium_andersonii.AAC.1